MKILSIKFWTIVIVTMFITSTSFAQNAKENNSFRNFSANDNNQENINAYFLSYLCTLMYPERLAREVNVSENTLINNDSRFFNEYKKRVQHWFYNPADPKPIAPKVPNEPSMDALGTCPQLKGILDKLPKTQSAIPAATKKFELVQIPQGKLKVMTAARDIIMPEGKIKQSLLSGDELLERLKKEKVCEDAYSNYLKAVKVYEVAYRFYERKYDAYLKDFEAWEDRVPDFEFFYNTSSSDRRFRDPEAILISTPTAVVVVFRGTDKNTTANLDVFKETGEWIATDAMAVPVAPGNGINGFVHSGFWNSLSAIKSTLADRIKFYRNNDKKVWITGHSLGGGQAALFASYLQFTKNIPVQGIYVFGSPSCVGNKEFANQMNATFTNRAAEKYKYQRFEFKRDFVSMIPIDMIGNFTPLKYEKAGVRNWFNEGRFFFNRDERSAFFDNGIPSFCHHTPEFYANELFSLITRVSLDKATQLPSPPNAPKSSWTACSGLDF